MRIVVSIIVVLAALAGRVEAASLTLACLDTGRVLEACRANAAAFAQESGHTVRVVSGSPLDRVALEEYQALLAIESPRLDVIQIPDAWVPTLADHLMMLDPVDPPDPFIAAADAGITPDGRRLGYPQFLAISVLFLRNDVIGEGRSFWSTLREGLLSAPADGATRLSLGGGDPAFFSFFLDFLYGTGATSLGDRADVERALSLLAELVGPVAAPGISRMRVREAASAFVGGDVAALVARSTQAPHVRQSELADQIAESPLPAFRDGPKDAAVLASTWYVAVSRHTAEREAARALAAYLASPEVQRENALAYGLAPTRVSLYSDPEVIAAGPILSKLSGLLDRLAGPPTGTYGTAYLDLADSVAENVRLVLRGDMEVDAAASAIGRAVRRAQRARTN